MPSDKVDDGGPAFPDPAPREDGHPGMPLRDWLLGRAFQGLLSNSYIMRAAMEAATQEKRTPEEAIGLAAHSFVNELMAQRKQEPK